MIVLPHILLAALIIFNVIMCRFKIICINSLNYLSEPCFTNRNNYFFANVFSDTFTASRDLLFLLFHFWDYKGLPSVPLS